MKQISQSYRTGNLRLADVPPPSLGPTELLVQTAASAISLGTEGKKVSTARQSLLGKARSRPDLVKQVIQTAQREGIQATYQKVMNRLDEPTSLGYSAAGTVLAVGRNVTDFCVGDRIACGGEGAAHAELLAVGVNLCAKIPDGVLFEQAAFATVGAIALQGVRQANATLGESVAVIGLGLVGQLTVQLLKANGCRVVGVDLDPSKVEMAKVSGADLALSRTEEYLEAAIHQFSRGFGVDAVLITAATSSNDPAELAVTLCRDRGRIVVVGDVRMDFPRNACYYKELQISLSRSYGPGRYDPIYEERGIDYPIGYVRWTEQRNMEAFLDLLDAKKIELDKLITHRIPFGEAEEAYDLIAGKVVGKVTPLGIVFHYGDTTEDHLMLPQRFLSTQDLPSSQRSERTGIGFIGAGSFARKYLIPPIVQDPHAQLVGVCTATGISGESTAQKFGFAYATGDHQQLLDDSEIDAVFIATRHEQHGQLVLDALMASKSVFVEKPLTLKEDELDKIVELFNQRRESGDTPRLQVGFNRRFAPLTKIIRQALENRVEPLMLHYRINAGFVDKQHWTQDIEVGGGRVLGELCHFVDYLTHLTGAPVHKVYATKMDNAFRYSDDNVCVNLTFTDGSVGSLLYLANGDNALPKERVEVSFQSQSILLDDFTRVDLYRSGNRQTQKSRQDKGHRAEVAAFLQAVRQGAPSPIPVDQIINVTQATLAVVKSIHSGHPIYL